MHARHANTPPGARPGSSSPPRPARRMRRWRGRGFTLIEAALTTVIIGTAVLAIVAAQQAYHQQNDWAQRSATAHLLANEIRELTLTLPVYDPFEPRGEITSRTGPTQPHQFRSVVDFAGDIDGISNTGSVFHPPINALRMPIDDLEQWRQVVSVHSVRSSDITVDEPFQPLGSDDELVRLNVRVEYRRVEDEQWDRVTDLTWVVNP